MQIHELSTRTPGVYDYAALDTGSQTYKAQVGNLKPQFVSYDAANPTSWANVDTVGSNSPISSVFEKLTYIFRNVRYLWKLIGSNAFSNVAETISGAIGNTALTTTATSISGAIAEHEGDISTINNNLSTLIHKSFSISENSSKTFTIPGGSSKHVFYFFSAYTACRGAAVIIGQSNAYIGFLGSTPSGITATLNADKITIAVTNNTYVESLTFAGAVPTV